MDNVCHIFILGNEGYHFRFRKNRAHAGNHNIFLPLQSLCAHFLQWKSERSCHHFKKTSRSRRALIIHQEILYSAVFVNADCLNILSSDVNDRTHPRIQIMRPFCVAGNLCDTVIAAVNIGTSVSRCHDSYDFFLLNTSFFHRQFQTLFRTHHCPATGRDNHCRLNFSVPVQNDHICTGWTAVNSGCIVNSWFHSFLCLLADFLSRIGIVRTFYRFWKCLDSRQ